MLVSTRLESDMSRNMISHLCRWDSPNLWWAYKTEEDVHLGRMLDCKCYQMS